MRRTAHKPTLTVLAAVAVTLLSGCGDTGVVTSPTPTANRECQRLTNDEVDTLAADHLTGPDETAIAGLQSCVWHTKDNSTAVTVTHVDASVWATKLPALLDQVEKGGLAKNEKTQEQLANVRGVLEAGGSMDAATACQMFSTLLEMQGQPAGTTRSVFFYPTKAHPQAMTGQACENGVFTNVSVARPDLKGTTEEGHRVLAALISAAGSDGSVNG
ncbi:hypothetical protein ACPPVT_15035 [Angustibacter sp. McL0619]|uniref:hypothetical protein n=1 Tax=Angustibacter sp. McL0619 TaxID=3415676 RepID=UPI003CE7B2A4